mmetsp:Transcript_91139/g.244400  ORF Transcript_91139/g.244400 Transcript_91139/m.244400 type:complete len:230 (-) Transcript_91139:314-1003(-)
MTPPTMWPSTYSIARGQRVPRAPTARSRSVARRAAEATTEPASMRQAAAPSTVHAQDSTARTDALHMCSPSSNSPAHAAQLTPTTPQAQATSKEPVATSTMSTVLGSESTMAQAINISAGPARRAAASTSSSASAAPPTLPSPASHHDGLEPGVRMGVQFSWMCWSSAACLRTSSELSPMAASAAGELSAASASASRCARVRRLTAAVDGPQTVEPCHASCSLELTRHC